MTNLTRCLAYLDKLPTAQAGAGGHDATFRAACECVRFGLTDSEAWQALSWYNDYRCNPKWSDKELRHKLSEAQKVARAGERASAGRPVSTFTPPAVIPNIKVNFASVPDELLQADDVLQVPEVNPDELIQADEWCPTDDELQVTEEA